MISKNYDKSVDIQRLEFDDESGSNQQGFEAYLTGIPCHIQPLDDSLTQDISVGFGKDLLMFCAIYDIQEGDRVIWDTKEYRIVGLKALNHGREAHMEIRIRAFES